MHNFIYFNENFKKVEKQIFMSTSKFFYRLGSWGVKRLNWRTTTHWFSCRLYFPKKYPSCITHARKFKGKCNYTTPFRLFMLYALLIRLSYLTYTYPIKFRFNMSNETYGIYETYGIFFNIFFRFFSLIRLPIVLEWLIDSIIHWVRDLLGIWLLCHVIFEQKKKIK